MRVLGIIGGIGPPSTVEYYRSIVEIYQRRTSGRDPRIIINSIDGAELLELISANRREEMTEYLLAEIRRIAAAGAELGLLASNTVHMVFPELQAVSPIQLISIVEAASDAAAGLTRLGLFATRFTVQADIYRSVFARRGIEVFAPNAEDQELIHTKYFDELVAGQFLPETRSQLLEVASRMRSEYKVEGIILGGTELPLLLRDESWNGLRFLDAVRIHAEAAVARMLT
jgi:aspartate racemase